MPRRSCGTFHASMPTRINGVLPKGAPFSLLNPTRMLRTVVSTTYAVFPPTNGGQRRMADVYCALADRGAEITIVALTPYGTQPKRWSPYRGIVEECIVTSKAEQRSYGRVSKSLSIVLDDVLADRTPQLPPAYMDRASEFGAGADIVIASRPYLLSSTEHSRSVPIVYEAMDD